jgi:hypothetical protein
MIAWDELDVSPTLATIRQTLEVILDAPLLDALDARRHNGNDTNAISVLWGVLLSSIILRHTAMIDWLEKLQSNAALHLLIGIESDGTTTQTQSRPATQGLDPDGGWKAGSTHT